MSTMNPNGDSQVIYAKPWRLKSGKWGARLRAEFAENLYPGDEIRIRTRSGKEWPMLVDRIERREREYVVIRTRPRGPKQQLSLPL